MLLTPHLRLFAFAVLVLTCLHAIADGDSGRLRQLAKKVKCDCGCGDILSECPHIQCKRQPALNREISDAILRGDTDEQILKTFAAAHGSAMLVTPVFQGFDRLLWIVPSLVGILAFVLFLYGFRTLKQNGVDR